MHCTVHEIEETLSCSRNCCPGHHFRCVRFVHGWICHVLKCRWLRSQPRMIFILILNNTYLVCLERIVLMLIPNDYIYTICIYILCTLSFDFWQFFFWMPCVLLELRWRVAEVPCTAAHWRSATETGAAATGGVLAVGGGVGCWVGGWSMPQACPNSQMNSLVRMFHGYVGEFLDWSKDSNVKTKKTQVVISCDIELCQLAWDKQIYEISYDNI